MGNTVLEKQKTSQQTDTIIPRNVLFGNPDHMAVSLSPNGKYVSYIAPNNGVLNVWVAPYGELSKAKVVTDDKSRGIRKYFWSYDNQHILYMQDQKGDENWRIYSVNIDDLAVKDFTSKDKVKSYVLKSSHKYPDELLIAMNARVSEYFDIYHVNLSNNKIELIYENIAEYSQFLADDDFNVRIGYKMNKEGEGLIYRFENADFTKPKLYKTIPYNDMRTTYLSHLTTDGKYLYMGNSIGRDTSALIQINLENQDTKLIYQNDKADLSDFLYDPQTKIVEAAASNYLRKEWQMINSELTADFDFLSNQEDGEVEILTRTYDDNFWAVVYLKDSSPYKYYIYDRANKKVEFLFTSNSKQENKPFTKMHPIVIKARDSLEMVSYLSVPRWLDNGKGIPTKPVPLIIWVHGGPNARDIYGFDGIHQWLANRGYAVLSVNYRGSSGFGKKFLNEGNAQWYDKMQEDLEDAANWSVKVGITEKDKIVIGGGSYGGYSALASLTKTPDFYAAGISIVCIANFITYFETIPPYWRPWMADLVRMIGGDPETEEGREYLRSISPLTHADKIKKPLLLVHGAHDPRIHKRESDQIAAKVKENNVPLLYLLYSDEGHGLARPENRLSFFANAEEFLAKFLKGRLQPDDGDYEGSTIEFIEKEY
ncbi:MAG: S9 family peptidase [Rickettsiaceae bacterium]|nr:S9 family peptidase [Rickettsiaceae bacterium]